MRKELLDYLLTYSDGIITINQSTEREFEALGVRIPIGVLRNPMPKAIPHERDICRNQWNIRAEDFVIGYAGRFVEEKNIYQLLKVLELFKGKIPVKLLLAGDITNEKQPEEVYFNKCLHLIKDNLEDQVVFTGWLSREQMAEFYTAIDCSVLLSKFREGCGFIVEGYPYGKPAIATNIGANAEHIINYETGFLIDASDVENQLTDAIYKLYTNKEKYEKMCEATKKYVEENHSYDKGVDVLTSMIEKVCTL